VHLSQVSRIFLEVLVLTRLSSRAVLLLALWMAGREVIRWITADGGVTVDLSTGNIYAEMTSIENVITVNDTLLRSGWQS
jgi:hypothetical protein